mmetsp:Transcript_13986/g.52445  ORF Transcript_13986/g.52445 Transcript_13986/m.52445 type:complete len:206 (+) Transcript_13986:1007-1624(+)
MTLPVTSVISFEFPLETVSFPLETAVSIAVVSTTLVDAAPPGFDLEHHTSSFCHESSCLPTVDSCESDDVVPMWSKVNCCVCNEAPTEDDTLTTPPASANRLCFRRYSFRARRCLPHDLPSQTRTNPSSASFSSPSSPPSVVLVSRSTNPGSFAGRVRTACAPSPARLWLRNGVGACSEFGNTTARVPSCRANNGATAAIAAAVS